MDQRMFCLNCEASMGSIDILTSDSPTATQLEAEINLTERMMQALLHKQNLLRRRINSLSPTAKVPPEILIEIFRLVCHPQPQDLTEESVTPLFFGRICKEWRDIAWSAPLLWSTIALHITNNRPNAQIRLLEEWLCRVQTSPLIVKLSCDDEHGDESIFGALRKVMEILSRHSANWQALDCLVPPQCYELLDQQVFPNLTSVAIRPPKGTISTFSEPPNMFRSAPRLLDVNLSGYNFSSMVLPWPQLRRFRTQFLTVAECLKVFQQAHNLEDCHLESVYSPNAVPTPTSELLHHNLRSLDVTLIKASALSLLNFVTLPALTDLRIHNTGAAGNLRLAPIPLFVSRSGCAIQTLTLKKDAFDDEDLVKCLKAMPSLVELRLEAVSWRNNPRAGLTIRLVNYLQPSYHSGSCLIPKLRLLQYRGAILCDDDNLVDMLVQRWEAHKTRNPSGLYDISPLCKVELVSPASYYLSSPSLEKLRCLRSEGMDVTFRSDFEHIRQYGQNLFTSLVEF